MRHRPLRLVWVTPCLCVHRSTKLWRFDQLNLFGIPPPPARYVFNGGDDGLFWKWECRFKRTALLDPVTLLRTVGQVGTTSTEIFQICLTLFLEQCCGLRSKISTTTTKSGNKSGGSMYKSPSLTFRGILLRRYVVELCKQKYPQFKTELDAFLDMSWYKTKLGVDSDGTQDSHYPHASIRGPGVSFCWCRGISARRSWIIKMECL